MSNVELLVSERLTTSDPKFHPVLIVGQLHNLTRLSYDTLKVKLQPRVDKETYLSAISNLHPSATDTCSLWLTEATVAALPNKCSRHNAPSRAHALTKIVRSCISGRNEYIVIICERQDVVASACAVARALPLYNRKSNLSQTKRTVTVEFVLVTPGTANGPLEHLTPEEAQCAEDAMKSVRLAARITDTPCLEMNTLHFIKEIEDVGKQLDIEALVIQGEDLEKQGFGGLYHVGKAANFPPALVVLSHLPVGATSTVAWVGKGIVYDTGGLSIKGKSSMPGMKRDCGGAAAVLGAFLVAVKQGFQDNLHAVFCLAENAVGPTSLKPDDVITLYSGRTVEVNNTDAEGRLVLGDGVAYAAKDLQADVIVDIATLTGAQGLATGRHHAAVMTNQESWEGCAVHAGKMSGDLVHPLIFCPELHFNEFSSAVADMKNSTADRSNCEVSCAGLFIGSHIGFDWPGAWIHIDMAYPVYSGERSTGYGVSLLLAMFASSSSSPLLQSLTQPSSASTSTSSAECPYPSPNKKIKLR